MVSLLIDDALTSGGMSVLDTVSARGATLESTLFPHSSLCINSQRDVQNRLPIEHLQSMARWIHKQGRGGGATHNLELHGLALKLDGTNLEVNTDGTDVALGVRIVGEPKEQARLRVMPRGGDQLTASGAAAAI
jgi:hypothetical protein